MADFDSKFAVLVGSTKPMSVLQVGKGIGYNLLG